MFSADRVSHLSHLLLDALIASGSVNPAERSQMLKKVKVTMDSLNRKFDSAWEQAEKKVQSTRKNLSQGSSDYFAQVERIFFEEFMHVQ